MINDEEGKIEGPVSDVSTTDGADDSIDGIAVGASLGVLVGGVR
jgi:hypothetical protein